MTTAAKLALSSRPGVVAALHTYLPGCKQSVPVVNHPSAYGQCFGHRPVGLQHRKATLTAASSPDAIDVKRAEIDERLPVTILTGFLGSGKTTLLNSVLSKNHGRRVAVIENEFGAIDIDSSLILAKETVEGVDVVSSLNGCVCCSVRGDLIEALEKLIITQRNKFDHIIIETTGLADPRPIIDIFTLSQLTDYLKLDGVVTLVDAKNIERHLDDSKKSAGAVNEALQQIAYADRVVLNKTDLVGQSDLERLERRVGSINSIARIERARNADVPVDYVLGVGGFDLDRIGEEIADIAGGHSHENNGHSHDHAHQSHEEHSHSHGNGHSHSHSTTTQQDSYSSSSDGHQVFEESHSHTEHDAYHSHGHSHSHDHQHDDSVTSVAFTVDGDMDLERVNEWLGAVLQGMSNDLFRYKGILSIKGMDSQFVFQGVHDHFMGSEGRDWRPNETRRSQMVFIGRKIDDGLLKEGFELCAAPKPQPTAA